MRAGMREASIEMLPESVAMRLTAYNPITSKIKLILLGVVGAIVLGLLATVVVQTYRLHSAQQELMASDLTIQTFTDAQKSNLTAIEDLERELKACATKRAEAEARGKDSILALKREIRDISERSKELQDALKKDMDATNSSDCGQLSSRATGLLIEAARSANRGEDRQ